MTNANYGEVGCKRCGGSGFLPQYRHVDGGACFECFDPHKDAKKIAGQREIAAAYDALRRMTPAEREARDAKFNAECAQWSEMPDDDSDEPNVDLCALFAEVVAEMSA